MTPIIIAKGTSPFEAVKDAKLIHVKPEYETNRLPVHWSACRKNGFNKEEFLEAVNRDPEILAVWESRDKYIIAWVDLKPETIEPWSYPGGIW